MKPDADLSRRARAPGANYYGNADLTGVQEFIRAQGGDRVTGYPRAIVMGIRLPDNIVDMLEDRTDRTGAALYRHTCYDTVNAALDTMALRTANTLQQLGYRAFPVPASKRANHELIAGVFSQKLAAHLAGLGWIGRSCLLVTPECGPRVRWVTVLTDAPLAPTGPAIESRCGVCRACVEICPVHAFTGRPFIAGEPREARYNAALCDRYFKELEAQDSPAVCGLCLWVCPYGRRKPGERGRAGTKYVRKVPDPPGLLFRPHR